MGSKRKSARVAATLVGLFFGFWMVSSAAAQGPPASGSEVLPLPKPEQIQGNRCPLDLGAALARVAGYNPQVAFAAARYREACARLEAARVLWLPSIRAGVSYNKHEGTLQEANGDVLDASRSALATGMGVGASGTGSPAVPGLLATFRLTDAIYQPLIAGNAAAAQREAARTTTQELLLETALAYLDLLAALQRQSIAEATLQNAQQLADLTAAFAASGQGQQSDADRARAELMLRKNDVTRAEEDVRVVSARLTELLHWDPTIVVQPEEPALAPIELVDQQVPLTELLARGLSCRPELAESRYLVAEAAQRYRRERTAPLLPSTLLGISYDGFGGGPGDDVANFRDRFDLDALAYWEVRNFGLGERAARNEARARCDQARFRQVQLMDQVAREVSQAHAQVQSRRGQIAEAERAVQAASESYRRNLERIRNGQGLPIEALQAIQALDAAWREYLRAVLSYDEAQFRLERALGWPM